MITIVFAKPRRGKTAYMTALAKSLLDYSEDSRELLNRCRSMVESMNFAGGDFKLPNSPPVYSNYPIRVQLGSRVSESFYIDGFHLGMYNQDVPVFPVLPCAWIFLSEAQRYYNSRRSMELPSWVSRFYEQHGHFDLNIVMDVQRPALIDINIREITDRFVEILGLEHHYDASGNIISTDFHLREFDDWKHVEKYIDGSADGVYEDRVFHFEGCVFDYYESKSYFRQFIPKDQFSMYPHLHGDNIIEDAEIAQIMYKQEPPEGYYKRRESKNAKSSKSGDVDSENRER